MSRDRIISLLLLSVPASAFIGASSYVLGFGKTMSEALALACYRVIKSKEEKANEDIN